MPSGPLAKFRVRVVLDAPAMSSALSPSALIGYSGLVGANLLDQCSFDDLYRSTNIELIEGREYRFIACAGCPGTKYLANRFPEEDWVRSGLPLGISCPIRSYSIDPR